MKLSRKTRFGARRGNAMVEFALASTILIPVFIGTFQFGYTFYVYNLLSTQIRAGARYGSVRAFRCADTTSIAKFKTAVANMVRFGNPDGTGTLIEPGMNASQLDVEIKDKNGVDADATHIPAYVTVSTTSYSVDAVFKTFIFTGNPFMRFQYVGRYASKESEP